MNLAQYRRRQDHAATLTAVLVAGIGCAGALLPAVEHAITLALAVLVAMAVLAGLARWVARVRRERREDAADALAGSAWRATHMPHRHHEQEREGAGQHGDRAGVA